MSDYFTKGVEAYLIRDMKANDVAETLVEGFITRMDVPMVIHSDQGCNFEHMCAVLVIKKTRVVESPVAHHYKLFT